jgi:hypothetical protein
MRVVQQSAASGSLAHAFDEGGDDVVVFVAGAIVEQRLMLRGLADVGNRDRAAVPGLCQFRGNLERAERAARVARSKVDDLSQRVVANRQFHRAESALAIGERAFD